MRDRTLRLQVDTQELKGGEMAELMQLFNEYGYFLFAPNAEDILEVDVESLPPVVTEKNQKTPSQRMRAALHVLWQQTANPNEISAEEFYRIEMEKFINHVKSKLQ